MLFLNTVTIAIIFVQFNREHKEQSLGSTTKKQQVLNKCREVMSHLSDVCEKYQESIACVLGNSFVFGCDDEKEEVRNIISEVVEP